MSDIVNLSAGAPMQSISEILAPGIVGLFVQGLETGLVISQLSQWLYLERKEGVGITLLVVFVTTVGLSAFARFFSNQNPYLINVPIAWRLLFVFFPHGESMFITLGKL